MMKLKKFLYILAVIWIFISFAIFTPAINIQSLGFWFFILFATLPFIVIGMNFKVAERQFFKDPKNKRRMKLITGLCIFVLLACFVGTPLFGGLNTYRNRIKIPASSNFSEIEPFDQTQVQIIDKEVAASLADRVFGEMGAEVVSQYQISDNYASAVVNNTMLRITPVEYSSFIKWLSTCTKGTPGYISVNVTTGETVFHDVEDGLKYTPNARLFNNLTLHLRLKYPNFIFGQTKFEVDDNYKPYWVSQVMKYSFVGKAEDTKGVVITDPTSGACTYYDVDEVPSWVDNVYSAPQISQQYNVYGKYVNGLFNFSQRGITAVTDDYAYLQKNGHLWMYTGVTSIGNDESNVGFIYVDLQNKDVIYIVSAGAEEYSARASAEGALQEKGYSAVFPTMVNIEEEPVYFMGLKDNAGLIKAYAFVSYKNYQKVGVGTTVVEALKNYTGKNVVNTEETENASIEVLDVKSAVVEGFTIYYIKDVGGVIYTCSIEVSDKLPFIASGDILEVLINGKTIVEIK